MEISSSERGLLEVTGLTPAVIGDRAAAAGLTLHELALQEASLEEAFMTLTRDAVEYSATTTTTATQTDRFAGAGRAA